MYVTINFLSCLNVDKTHLLDATGRVFELRLEVQAWNDGLCNNRKNTSFIFHKEHLMQRVPPCTRTASLKFKLTNQGSEGGKTALSRRQCLLT